MDRMDYFIELYGGLPRCGPGDNASTRRAFQAMESLPPGPRILDVGCGSGRYTVALAERGAEVLGIDFASNMLALAHDLAEKRGVAARCCFVPADFLEYDFNKTFNISLAIGFFDYVSDPLLFLEKLRRLTEEKVIVTFPRPGGWRAAQRRLRYRLKGCPIYFHSQESMATHFAAAGYEGRAQGPSALEHRG